MSENSESINLSILLATQTTATIMKNKTEESRRIELSAVQNFGSLTRFSFCPKSVVHFSIFCQLYEKARTFKADFYLFYIKRSCFLEQSIKIVLVKFEPEFKFCTGIKSSSVIRARLLLLMLLLSLLF